MKRAEEVARDSINIFSGVVEDYLEIHACFQGFLEENEIFESMLLTIQKFGVYRKNCLGGNVPVFLLCVQNISRVRTAQDLASTGDMFDTDIMSKLAGKVQMNVNVPNGVIIVD